MAVRKSLAVLILGMVVSASLFLVGFSRPSQTLVHPDLDQNWGFLQSPQKLAANELNFFVISGQASTYHLSIIHRATREEIISESFSNMPLDMRVAGNHLFLFWGNNYRVLNVLTLTDGFDVNSFTAIPYTGMPVASAFGLNQVGGQIRVLFAHNNDYGWHTLNTMTLMGSAPMGGGSLLSVNHNTITAIAQDAAGITYLFARFGASNNFNIFRSTENMPLVDTDFLRPYSFHVSGNSLVFIEGIRIFVQNTSGTGASYINAQPSFVPGNFSLGNSYQPRRLSVVGNSVFVLDGHKSSIDLYTINHAGVIGFSSTAFAAMGNELGFMNWPTAMTLIDEGQLIVADLSPRIRRLSAAHNYRQLEWSDEGVFINDMAFNNHNRVFASVVHNLQNQVWTFDLEGNRLATSWTGFNNVSQLVVNNATQEIYAMDTGAGQILRLIPGGTEVVTLPSPVTITSGTRAVIANRFDTDFLVLVNAGGHWEVNMTTNIASPLALTFDVLDVTVDTVGGIIVLGEDSGNKIAWFDGQTLELTGATVATFNPALNFDRMTTRLYWLGARHAVESITLNEVWSFRNTVAPNFVHYNWNTPTPILQPTSASPLFGQVTEDALLFEFPASVNAIRALPELEVFIVLRNLAPDFNYSLISWQGYVRYLNNRFIIPYTDYFDDTVDLFGTTGTRVNDERLGRVILNGVRIFKYPTSDSVHVSTINKTRDRATAITVTRRILIPDLRDWEFFEVRLNANGTLNPTSGAYVGFINFRHVINYYLAPSMEVHQFRPNARTTTAAQLFNDSLGQELREGEILVRRTEVFVRGGIDRALLWTAVYYYDEEMGRVMHGFVWTEYLVPRGISIWQIMGIAALVIGAITATVFLAMHFRRRRTVS
ncbi:MAG: hypothetical protein FWE31_05230 [Firmicutes bacterium]|nr:hypothetical protein [Bacillota bacterium]